MPTDYSALRGFNYQPSWGTCGLEIWRSFEADRLDKPLVLTETCWGSLDDAQRAAIIRFSLEQVSCRGLGWLAYVLHESRVIDCHGPSGGPVSNPGNLAFINADGSIRPGHEILNTFV